MANIPTTDDETTERISNISHQHLAERFTGEFSFGPVLPVSRTDYQEEGSITSKSTSRSTATRTTWTPDGPSACRIGFTRS